MRLRQSNVEGLQLRNTPKRMAGASVRSIVSHKTFVPIVTFWGAALCGGAILVQHGSAILHISAFTKLGAMGGSAQFVFAVIAAILGGLVAFFVASTLRNRATKHGPQDAAASMTAPQRGQLINPVADLGSESLDAPIEEMPFGAEQDGEFEELPQSLLKDSDDAMPMREPALGKRMQRSKGFETPSRNRNKSGVLRHQLQTVLKNSRASEVGEDSPREEPVRKKVDKLNKTKTRTLDLGEFSELPGRNAVWVEEPTDAKAQQIGTEEADAVSAATALERLRKRPPAELSLVEMVERFAAALHERQEAERQRNQGAPGRDPALADALKALSMFNEDGFDPSALDNPDPEIACDELSRTERKLRNAVSKLQNLHGAA